MVGGCVVQCVVRRMDAAVAAFHLVALAALGAAVTADTAVRSLDASVLAVEARRRRNAQAASGTVDVFRFISRRVCGPELIFIDKLEEIKIVLVGLVGLFVGRLALAANGPVGNGNDGVAFDVDSFGRHGVVDVIVCVVWYCLIYLFFV